MAENSDSTAAAEDEAILVALGSNLAGAWPSSRALLEAALARLPGLAITVTARSDWWRSAAWPEPSDPAFLNGVVRVVTPLPPRSLLGALLGLEASFGRTRAGANARRTLDLDLLAYCRLTFAAPGLVLPHPRAFERRFVTGPLAEILPAWRHPTDGRTARELDASAAIGRDAEPVRAP